VLSIWVQSVQPVLNDMFNITDTRTIAAGGDPSNLFLSGYSVEAGGHINLPTVGKVKLLSFCYPRLFHE
jgi:polysaccharide export outer membrane protein